MSFYRTFLDLHRRTTAIQTLAAIWNTILQGLSSYFQKLRAKTKNIHGRSLLIIIDIPYDPRPFILTEMIPLCPKCQLCPKCPVAGTTVEQFDYGRRTSSHRCRTPLYTSWIPWDLRPRTWPARTAIPSLLWTQRQSAMTARFLLYPQIRSLTVRHPRPRIYAPC